jgi:hypothetical protein
MLLTIQLSQTISRVMHTLGATYTVHQSGMTISSFQMNKDCHVTAAIAMNALPWRRLLYTDPTSRVLGYKMYTFPR